MPRVTRITGRTHVAKSQQQAWHLPPVNVSCPNMPLPASLTRLPTRQSASAAWFLQPA